LNEKHFINSRNFITQTIRAHKVKSVDDREINLKLVSKKQSYSVVIVKRSH